MVPRARRADGFDQIVRKHRKPLAGGQRNSRLEPVPTEAVGPGVEGNLVCQPENDGSIPESGNVIFHSGPQEETKELRIALRKPAFQGNTHIGSPAIATGVHLDGELGTIFKPGILVERIKSQMEETRHDCQPGLRMKTNIHLDKGLKEVGTILIGPLAKPQQEESLRGHADREPLIQPEFPVPGLRRDGLRKENQKSKQ